MSSAYFSAIGLRLSFIVGVSSSPPGSHSVSSSLWRRIFSTLERRPLAVSIASAIAASGVVDARGGLGVEHDQRDVERAPVADHDGGADQRSSRS